AVADDDEAGGVIAQLGLLVLQVGLVSPNVARRVVAARPGPANVPIASRNDRAREPRRSELLHPRQGLLRELHGEPSRRWPPRAVMRVPSGDARRPSEGPAGAVLRAALCRLPRLDRRASRS